MRADAKVYVLKDADGAIVSIDASLKHLYGHLADHTDLSRSAPDRRTALALLRDTESIDIPMKRGISWTLETYWLGTWR